MRGSIASEPASGGKDAAVASGCDPVGGPRPWLELWYRFAATHEPQLFWGAFLPYTLMAMAIHALFALGRRLPRAAWLLLGGLPAWRSNGS